MSVPILLAALAALAPLAPLAPIAPIELGPDWTETLLTVERGTALALRDVDGDGRLDLLSIDERGVSARYLREDGSYAEEPDARMDWPGRFLAWDLVDLDGDGAVELATIVDGRSLRVYEPADGFGEGRELLTVRGTVPRGIFRMRFARDVDGDGRADVVVPGPGRYDVYLRLDDEDGGFSEPIVVDLEASVHYQLGDPDSLDDRFGQSVRIPWFSIEDVDGDGRADLVAKTDAAVLFHIASPELPDEPTWRLDLEALRAELPELDGIQFSDLLAHGAQRVSWQVRDLDGEAPRDLVLQIGSTFKIYLGGSRNGPDGKPDQVLRSSGNVLYFFLRDVQSDELPELQLARSEGLSLSRVLRWLILPGALDFDLYTYRNDAGTFSRKPTARHTVKLEIPRLLSFVDEVEELESELEAQQSIPARRISLDGDGANDDVADIVGRELLLFRDTAPEAEDAIDIGPADGSDGAPEMDAVLEAFILDDLDRMDDGGTKTIDLREIDEWTFSAGAALRETCSGSTPVARIPLKLPEDQAAEKATILARDLDGDGRSDLIVVGKDEDRYTIQFVVGRFDG